MAETAKIHLNDTDEAILNEIDENGRVTVDLLNRIFDKSRTYLSRRVNRMVEHGVLVKPANRVYDRPEAAREYLNEEKWETPTGGGNV